MNSLSLGRATGALLIVVPLGFTVCFTLLQQLFEYPDILRQPTAAILAKFAAGGAPLVAVWYALTLTAVAFIPLTVLVHRVLASRGELVLLWVGTAFGLVAGLLRRSDFCAGPSWSRTSRSRIWHPVRARGSAPPRRWCSKPFTCTQAWASASTWDL